MYTNGLKDRFGSPLVSERDLDNLVMFPMDAILGRITSTEANLEDVNYNIDGINTDLNTVTKDLFDLKNQLDTEYVTVGKLDDVYNVVDTEIVKGLKERFTDYSNLVFPIATDGTDNAYVSSFRFGYKHCPKGLITKVSTYARDTDNATHPSKTEGCYLIAKVYNKADSKLVREQTSKNKRVVVERTNTNEIIFNTWEFDGILSPNENEVIKFVPSPDGMTQVSGYYMGMLVDTTHTHTDCIVGGDDDFVNNPISSGNKYLALCKFEGDFYKEKAEKQELEYYEKDFLKTLYTLSSSNQQIWDNNVNNEPVGQGQCKAFTLVRPYIRNGKYNEVRWTSQGASNVTVYCRITTRDLNGNDVQTVTSHNTENFNTAGLKSFRFNEEFEVNDNIGSLLFETSTDGINPSSTAQWRIRIIGNATKTDTDGGEMAANIPYICQVIFWGKKAQLGGDILTKTRADSLYAPNSGVTTGSYDWTPDYTNNIKLDVHEYTFPVNGWLVSRDWQYLVEQQNEIRIDDKPVGQVNDKGNFSILCKKDEVLTIENGLDVPFWFFPCKSEQYDYRVTHTPYDIWRGAVTTDAQGNTVVQNLYCPVATAWYGEKASSISIATVEDEVAYDSNGGFLCNIQSSEIVNGGGIFTGHKSMTSWNSDLQRLEDGSWMFNTCNNLKSFSSDLSNLTNGNKMFYNCSQLNSFTPNLSSLTTGREMFYYCSNLTTFSSDLSSLSDGYFMFAGCFQLNSFASDLSSLSDGNCMFYYCSNLTSFTSNISSLTKGQDMFDNCTGLETFNCDLPNLTDGRGMFQLCTNLTSFTSKLSSLTDSYKMFYGCKLTSFNCDLPSLTIGREMFYGCSQLTSFNGDLSSLTDSDYMFTYCSQLTTFSTDLPKLKNGQHMFYCCDNLTSFSSDLSSLTNGSSMFYHSSALTAFSSDLSSLTNGNNMFRDCLLDAQSVERILTTIPDYGSEHLKSIGITMDVAACPKASEIVGLQEGQIIPQNPDEIPVRHRGWCCYLSCANGSYTVPNITNKYDVSEANGYIPDASKWHDEVYVPNDLTIIQVRNGIAYDDDAVDPEL